MNPMASNLTLTTNYDNHVITLHDVTFLSFDPFRGTITGPIHNHDIDFAVGGIIDANRHVYFGYFNDRREKIILIISYDESIGISEWKIKIAIQNVLLDGIFVEDMDTCVFNEAMPVKGVHDG